jgi:hypothetical protein
VGTPDAYASDARFTAFRLGTGKPRPPILTFERGHVRVPKHFKFNIKAGSRNRATSNFRLWFDGFDTSESLERTCGTLPTWRTSFQVSLRKHLAKLLGLIAELNRMQFRGTIILAIGENCTFFELFVDQIISDIALTRRISKLFDGASNLV